MADSLRIRDKYHDYMTAFEMHACLRRRGTIDGELGRRKLELAQRSGAAGVGSGVIIQQPRGNGVLLSVVFDSAAWTGRTKAHPPRQYRVTNSLPPIRLPHYVVKH
jgi:hypothetical protein